MPRGLQLCNSFFLLGLIFIGNIKENENSDLEIYCKKRLRLYLMLNIGIGVVLLIIPGISEPPVRTLRATIPENERHIFR